jgi:nicotinamidase-related amidase
MANCMLLVMDMINDLVDPDGPSAKTFGAQCFERKVLTNTAGAIDKARRAGVPIGYVRIGFSADYQECPRHSPIFGKAPEFGLFKLGTRGTQVAEELAAHAGDADIIKHRVSPFYATTLEPTLRAQQITQIVLAGVSTNGVVLSGVREGHDRDYKCVVLEDCCAGASSAEHETALAAIQRFAVISNSRDCDFN